MQRTSDKPIGKIISAVLKVSKSRHTVFLSLGRSVCLLYVYAVMVIFLRTIAFGVYRAAFGQGTGPILLSLLNCTGRESSLLSCGHTSGPCSHSQDVGVVCPPCKL